MDTLIIVLMVCPNDFLFFVGDVETDLAHTIHVRECVPPMIELFIGCVPIVIEVGLKISFALVGHVVNNLWISVHVFPIKILTNVAVCHYLTSNVVVSLS